MRQLSQKPGKLSTSETLFLRWVMSHLTVWCEGVIHFLSTVSQKRPFVRLHCPTEGVCLGMLEAHFTTR